MTLGSRGSTYRRTERYDEALRDFNRALEIDPNNAWILGARGLTYQQMERYEAALADLCRSLEIDASDAWLLARRGETYLMSGDYEKGSADLNNALETDPNTVFLVDSLVPGAVGHLKRGEPEAASAIFGAIVSVSPNNSAAHNNYGFCLMPTDPACALDELNHARELGHNKLVNLADIVLALHLLKKDDEALVVGRSQDLDALPTEGGQIWMIDNDHALHVVDSSNIYEYLQSLLVHIEGEYKK